MICPGLHSEQMGESGFVPRFVLIPEALERQKAGRGQQVGRKQGWDGGISAAYLGLKPSVTKLLAIPSPTSPSTPFPRNLVQQPGTSLPWSATKVLFNWDLQETEMLYLSSLEPEKPRSCLDLASFCLAQPLGEGRSGLKGPWIVTCEETSTLA